MIKWGRGFVGRGIAAVLAGAMAAAAPAQACTNILVLAADGTPVYGRTLEYALETQSDVVVVPRNHEFIGTRPAKMAAPKWSSRYGFVGVMSFGQPFVSDGMNEKGLAGGALYFPALPATHLSTRPIRARRSRPGSS